MKSQERVESLLMTIDQLGVAKIKHLQMKHNLKSYRNACRVIKQLSPYVNETFFNKEKVIYLNKNGRNLIGSDKEVKSTAALEHSLLRNEVYLHLNSPIDWKTEYPIESNNTPTWMQASGIKVAQSKKLISDAVYSRNGVHHFVEIDNTRHMIDNHHKLKTYAEIIPKLSYGKNYSLQIYTTTPDRKRKFEKWAKELKLKCEVKIFNEIR
ncbi:MAG: hypothetical protein ACI35O_08085 [Bacillaceae bacterium]